MPEEPVIYEEPENEYATAASFTLYLSQVGKLSDLQIKTGMKRSEIVRKAIDSYYAIVMEVQDAVSVQ